MTGRLPTTVSDDARKHTAYTAHVAACRACTRCGDAVANPAGCPHPSPWAMNLNSLHARLVIVGKDFASADRMTTVEKWCEPDPKYPVNKNLPKLIEAAGLDAQRDVYLTNAILCLKRGPTSAALSATWIRQCSSFLRTTIDIIAPVAVAALGTDAWHALGLAFQLHLPPWADTIGRDPFDAPQMPLLYALAHPGHWGTRRRPLPVQQADWTRLGIDSRAKPPSAPPKTATLPHAIAPPLPTPLRPRTQGSPHRFKQFPNLLLTSPAPSPIIPRAVRIARAPDTDDDRGDCSWVTMTA